MIEGARDRPDAARARRDRRSASGRRRRTRRPARGSSRRCRFRPRRRKARRRPRPPNRSTNRRDHDRDSRGSAPAATASRTTRRRSRIPRRRACRARIAPLALEALRHGRVASSDGVSQHCGIGGRRHARDVDHVLERKRNAGQRRERRAARAFLVDPPRPAARRSAAQSQKRNEDADRARRCAPDSARPIRQPKSGRRAAPPGRQRWYFHRVLITGAKSPQVAQRGRSAPGRGARCLEFGRRLTIFNSHKPLQFHAFCFL